MERPGLLKLRERVSKTSGGPKCQMLQSDQARKDVKSVLWI